MPFSGSCNTARSISRSGSNSLNCSGVTPPGRKSRGRSPANVITVDSTPTAQGLPIKIASTLPSRSLMQCSAVVGLGEPERFALGAATGVPAADISSCAIGSDGKRIATVSSPALTSSGIKSLFGNIIVKGPGQNFSAHFFAESGMFLTSGGSIEISLICTISGLSCGRPLAANMRFTAAPLNASAPSPYTVSVGKATSPPFLIILAACNTAARLPPPNASSLAVFRVSIIHYLISTFRFCNML